MGTATTTASLILCQCPSSSSSSLSSLRVGARVSGKASHSQPKLAASLVDKTLRQIKNSGIIACLRANRSHLFLCFHFPLFSGFLFILSSFSNKKQQNMDERSEQGCSRRLILKSHNFEVALEAANAAIAGGISVLEIVMSTPGVFEVLQQLVKEHPTVALGVGTVLRIEDAKTAVKAGAKFLMSPAIVKDIMDYVQSGEVLYIPGAMTPTEILSAWDAGAKMVKVYPVSALGGFQYISALKKSFPHVSMVASQGIKLDSIEEYILRGASAVVLSDSIFDKEAITECNFNKIYELALSAALLGKKAVNA